MAFLAGHAATACHCCLQSLTWLCSWSISSCALFTLPCVIVWVSEAWSVLRSSLTFSVDRWTRLDRLMPARLWLVPRKMET